MYRYGFRIVGDCAQRRRLVDWRAAFRGYMECDPRAECKREGYLSAFQFGSEFRQYLESTGSTAGYQGPCWASYIWWDVDDHDLSNALRAARRLVTALFERYNCGDYGLTIYFSGAKGFHIGLATGLWQPVPGPAFHLVAKQFAITIAEQASVQIDASIYDRTRAFRAPNSKHGKSGLHKVPLTTDEVLYCSLETICVKAQAPQPTEWLVPSQQCPQAAADWQAATERVVERQTPKGSSQCGSAAARLCRATLAFIREGAPQGERAVRLFRAAANLTECGCPAALTEALLLDSALDVGLPPSEARRQIECGIAHAALQRGQTGDHPPDVADYDRMERWAIQHEGDSLPSRATEFLFGENVKTRN
jgi:hypothetical protein